MKLVTFRNNESAYRGLSDPVSVAMAAVAVYNVLAPIFGGKGNAGGYDSTGRFIPGDIDNRLRFLSTSMARNGLTTNDIDKNLVDSFIYQPSGWQGNVDRYTQQLGDDKKLNPEKYLNKQTPGENGGGGNISYPGTYGGGVSSSGFGDINIGTILLVGAGVFILANVLGGNKRGRK